MAGLIDIPLPRPVSLLPETWASRIALVLLVVGAAFAIWHGVRRFRANRYRRAALAELDRIERTPGIASDQRAAQLSLLVRRTALEAFPRETVAPLAGAGWLSFLDRSYGGHEFSEGVGRVLANAPYRRAALDADELRPLEQLIRRWIRGHHV
ncbi:DUF4381 domain-containing protein [Bradyrhizobium lablabi]|uniref:DUF4381 domain-containing protein n=1 Tax=Bradyrhizobium lablabi TaxID=722472 RepID=UPI001BA5A343|nr:DUF4381 domain-containing protein [Bradyrhizobium lablabi]MBR0692279.1 DUF4381 domain-containing protein [Bradyrhizobium lablabi]